MKPTYEQIAKSFDLWGEHVDPDATMNRQQFDALTIEQRIAIIVDTFGPEQAGQDF